MVTEIPVLLGIDSAHPIFQFSLNYCRPGSEPVRRQAAWHHRKRRTWRHATMNNLAHEALQTNSRNEGANMRDVGHSQLQPAMVAVSCRPQSDNLAPCNAPRDQMPRSGEGRICKRAVVTPEGNQSALSHFLPPPIEKFAPRAVGPFEEEDCLETGRAENAKELSLHPKVTNQQFRIFCRPQSRNLESRSLSRTNFSKRGGRICERAVGTPEGNQSAISHFLPPPIEKFGGRKAWSLDKFLETGGQNMRESCRYTRR